MRAEVEQDQDSHELESVGGEGGGEPEIDAGCGRDEKDGVEQKASGH